MGRHDSRKGGKSLDLKGIYAQYKKTVIEQRSHVDASSSEVGFGFCTLPTESLRKPALYPAWTAREYIRFLRTMYSKKYQKTSFLATLISATQRALVIHALMGYLLRTMTGRCHGSCTLRGQRFFLRFIGKAE